MALTRSEQMSRIRGSETTPELIVRRHLWAAGVRYRLNCRTPGGRADLCVPSKKFALFVDGCFWHGCPDHYVRPRSRNDFWDRKLAENVSRDRRQTLKLKNEGWRVLRVWEHDVRMQPGRIVRLVLSSLAGPPAIRAPSWRVVKVTEIDTTARLERRLMTQLLDHRVVRIAESHRTTAKLGRVRRTILVRHPSETTLDAHHRQR